jgi:hypothetical protein
MRTLLVGQPISDFTTGNEVRLYTTDFSKYDQEDLANREILVKCEVYSGYPDVRISFDENFSKDPTEDNWVIESSFAFLL